MASKKAVYEERKCFRYIINPHLPGSSAFPGELDALAGSKGVFGYVIETKDESASTATCHHHGDNVYEELSSSSKKQCVEQEVEIKEDVESIEDDEHLSECEDSDMDDERCCICGSRHGYNSLIQCSYCLEWIHLACYNEKSGSFLKGVPIGLFACHGEICKKIYIKLVKEGKRENYLNLEIDVPQNAVISSSFDTSHEDNDPGEIDGSISFIDEELHYSRSSSSGMKIRAMSHIEEAARRLIEISKANPIKFIAAKTYCKSLQSLSPETYLNIIEVIDHEISGIVSLSTSEKRGLIERLEQKKPPQSIRRVLEACGDGGIQTETLRCSFRKEGVEAFWVMNRFRPIEVALDLYRSALNRSRGPFHKPCRNRCSTGRMPDDFSKLEEFAATMNFDCHDPTNLTLHIGLYSDDSHSASGNVAFCPCWLSLTSMDPLVRFLERDGANGLVCFLPDKASIQYRFAGNEYGGPDALAQLRLTKSQRDKAFLKLRLKALSWICADIKRDEVDGLAYVLDGKEVRVRLLVNWYIADMKERRVLLGMSRGVYHCFRCYAFPGKPNDAQRHRGPRTQVQDKRIRGELKNGHSSTGDAVGATLQRRLEKDTKCFGIPLKDECPFTSSETGRIFTRRGPYELFNFDALHHKDGLIIYFVKFLEMRLGENFIAQSERFGNVYLLTKKLSMHVMELGLESYHCIPLAVMFAESSKKISGLEREELYLCACDLLQIVSLLTDPCPGFILDQLKATIESFSSRLYDLLEAINKSSGTTQHITPKMHELIEHVVEQVQVMGLPDAFSTKIFETMHQSLKSRMQASSMHSNGQAFREVLLTSFFQRVVDETSLRLNASSFTHLAPGSPWQSVMKFHIAQPLDQRNLSFADLLSMNSEKVFSNVYQTSCPVSLSGGMRDSRDVEIFGSTLYMQVFCALRNKEETERVVAVVPGTSKGRIFNGGTFNALAFRNPAEEFEDEMHFSRVLGYQKCPIPNCPSRHHDKEFEYACSAVRDGNTSYGLPVLFFDSTAMVLPLYPVKNFERTVPVHSAIFEVRCQASIKLVPFKMIRGICVYRPDYSKLAEFRGFLITGRNVFGYKSECEH